MATKVKEKKFKIRQEKRVARHERKRKAERKIMKNLVFVAQERRKERIAKIVKNRETLAGWAKLARKEKKNVKA